MPSVFEHAALDRRVLWLIFFRAWRNTGSSGSAPSGAFPNDDDIFDCDRVLVAALNSDPVSRAPEGSPGHASQPCARGSSPAA